MATQSPGGPARTTARERAWKGPKLQAAEPPRTLTISVRVHQEEMARLDAALARSGRRERGALVRELAWRALREDTAPNSRYDLYQRLGPLHADLRHLDEALRLHRFATLVGPAREAREVLTTLLTLLETLRLDLIGAQSADPGDPGAPRQGPAPRGGDR